MRVNVLSHTKAALIDSPNIQEVDRAETLTAVARWILADLTAEVPEYITRSEDEEFVLELETEKAAADRVDICMHYMRTLGLYTAAYYSDGFLGLTQNFNLQM